jgi:hypothetical protein
MQRSCEVCASLAAATATTAHKLRRVLVDGRIVALCEEHARLARSASVESIAELSRLFTEPDGRRSLVPRRSPLDRRVFPARPEGRRASFGRRGTDVE